MPVSGVRIHEAAELKPPTLVRRAAVLALLALGVASRATAQRPPWDDALTRFSADIAADVAQDDVGGIAAGVVLDGDLVWARAVAWADRDRRAPMGTSTISWVGSISTLASHGGSVQGSTANIAFDPDARIGVVLPRKYQRGATNLQDAAARLVEELRDIGR